MTPLLVGLGALEGKRFAVGEEIVIGRSEENAICIPDSKISRRHCALRWTDGRVEIADLGSRNGVFVNDVRVAEQKLQHGDRIRVGGYEFALLTREDEALPAGIQLDDTVVATGAAVTVSMDTDEAGLSGATGGEPSNVVRFLLRIATALSVARAAATVRSASIQGILEGLLLELLFEVIPAERGALIVVDAEGGEPVEAFTRDRSGASGTVPVSRRVMRRVLTERVGLFLPSQEESIYPGMPNKARNAAILAAPLLVEGFEAPGRPRVFGLIYLSAVHGREAFSESHLHLLTEVSVIASSAFENALYLEWLRRENARLEAAIPMEHSMVGKSQPMVELCSQISRVARSEATVLITGESGTGKELVARAIHQNSSRARKPMVAVNCAAITETLLESELFGHERGAFTGAVGQKLGKLEMAEGGTVFFDEIGEMPLTLQAKLLRVLQEREFERVGGTRTIRLNVRVLTATNRDLAVEVREARFREDLYYRLNVVVLRTPPLRERGEDVLPLALHFARRHAQQCNRKFAGFSERAQQLLLRHDWPGNVRELDNAIERAVVLGSGEVIREEDLPEGLGQVAGPDETEAGTLQSAVYEAKRKAVAQALGTSAGNVTIAARLLGVNANYLHRLMNQLGLR